MLIVMNQGKIEQKGTPGELVQTPKTNSIRNFKGFNIKFFMPNQQY
jgi:ABC-type Fe3+/spermidine/putrescine transport system ATPase subunit